MSPYKKYVKCNNNVSHYGNGDVYNIISQYFCPISYIKGRAI